MNRELLWGILDYDLVTGIWTWRYRPTGSAQWNGHFAGKIAGGIDKIERYWRIRIDGTLYHAHRLAFVYVEDRWPDDEVDHVNLDRSDCSWWNLREATHSQNGCNKKQKSTNTSGFKGVWFHNGGGGWVAELHVNKKRYRKFSFATAEAAAEAYAEMAKKHHGEFARAS